MANPCRPVVGMDEDGVAHGEHFVDGTAPKEGHTDPEEPSSKRARAGPPMRREIRHVLNEAELPTEVRRAQQDERRRVERRKDGGTSSQDRFSTYSTNNGVVVNVSRPNKEDPIFLAAHISKALKPHQISGVRFLFENVIGSHSTEAKRSKNTGLGCILAHAMGLGKTIQIIAFCDVFLNNAYGKRVMIVVPVNTLLNWRNEYKRWLPEHQRKYRLFMMDDTLTNLDERAKVMRTWSRVGGVMLIGYDLFRQMACKTLRRRRSQERTTAKQEAIDKKLVDELYRCVVIRPELLICDEGHTIKNDDAQISHCIKSVRTKRRVVLTGYPLQNNLLEYWCMVDFVRPNYLGTKAQFRNQFETPIMNGQCIDSNPYDKQLMRYRTHVLHENLKGFVQRRGHNILRNSIPPKSEHVVLLRMTPMQRHLYQGYIAHLRQQQQCSASDGSVSCNALKAFAVCARIWNHPDALYHFAINDSNDDDLEVDQPSSDARLEKMTYRWAVPLLTTYQSGVLENSPKFAAFFALLEASLRVNDRMIVFSQSLMTLNLLEEFLQGRNVPGRSGNISFWAKGRDYFRLDGSTSATHRDKLITTFNSSPTVKLFLVSTRAGSLGVNLVGANRVVVMDASWNPCHDSQAVCRVYRYGQTKATHIYRFITDNSIEKKIYDRQVNKEGMSARVVDENPTVQQNYKDIYKLISQDEHDPPVSLDISTSASSFSSDVVLENLVKFCGKLLTREPFAHDSLVSDLVLSSLEKRQAVLNFEKEHGEPLRVSPSTSASPPAISNATEASRADTNFASDSSSLVNLANGSNSRIDKDVLAEAARNENASEQQLAGVTMTRVTLPSDLSIPYGMNPIELKAGQTVEVIQKDSKTYLRFEGKIVQLIMKTTSQLIKEVAATNLSEGA